MNIYIYIFINELAEVCYKILYINANELEKCFSVYYYFPHLSRAKAESQSQSQSQEEAPLEYVYSALMQYAAIN